jgi:hypothetical protein
MALSFNATDTSINAGSPTILDDLGPLTWMAWIKPESEGENDAGVVIAKDDNQTTGWKNLILGLTDTIRFTQDYEGANNLERKCDNGSITMGVWQHVAATWEGTSSASGIHIYIDAQEPGYQTTQDGVGSYVSEASKPLIIGGAPITGLRTFDGLIDDVRIYDRVLTETEVRALYLDPFGPIRPHRFMPTFPAAEKPKPRIIVRSP